MSTIEVAVAGRGIQVKQGYEKPSAGDVNTCEVSLAIEIGGVWDSLPHKRVTFATRTASVTVDYAPTITIPYEVMVSPGALYLTLTGYDADGIEVARTHRMTYPIEVARAGADEGAEPSPATLDVVSRIDNIASTLEASETTRQEAFESAQNERSSAFQASMSEWQQDVAESVSHASNAATLANEAATNANNATSNANEAAESANSAASEAHNAANELREAAERGDFDGEPGTPGEPGAPGSPGADGYSPTASVTKNGGTATITVTDKNGTTTATVSDGAPGKDGSDATATDVRIAGKSITVDGVADIPFATNSRAGVVGVYKYGGLYIDKNGTITTNRALVPDIDGRADMFKPIAPSNLDYAVKAAMCDGKGAAWTDAEQAAAKKRMGMIGNFELIEEITLAEDVSSIARNATPSGKPYSFDSVAVLVEKGSASVQTPVNGWVRLNDRKPIENWGYINADNFISANNSFIGIFRKNDFGGHDSISYAKYSKGITHVTPFSNVEAIPSEIYRTDFGKVEDIYMYATEGKTIPAGAKISIYGVWA